ncbi:hypothetical protein ACFCZ3_20125 [Cellulosimicrobium cellulans]|uniref:hypothetical protein n=1 Tax=Cellulosimicrobium cellulans TaxID=1710 RepID=UPI0035E14208
MSVMTTFTTDSGTTTLTPEQMDGMLIEDVRPVARQRARAMLALYTGKPTPDDAEAIDYERLADLITDLVHLARAVDAARDDGTDVVHSALYVVGQEDERPRGWYSSLPAATRAAVPTGEPRGTELAVTALTQVRAERNEQGARLTLTNPDGEHVTLTAPGEDGDVLMYAKAGAARDAAVDAMRRPESAPPVLDPNSPVVAERLSVVIGHNVRRWSRYTVTNVTAAEREVLERDMSMDAVRLLSALETAERATFDGHENEDGPDPFDETNDPSVIEVNDED